MIMKKIIVFVLSFILITLLFCACGNVTTFDNNGLDNSTPSSQGPVGALDNGTPSSQDLVGIWTTDNERDLVGREAYRYLPRYLELHSDGTGDTDFFDINYSSETITWQIEDGQLHISSKAFDYSYDYEIVGNTLILTMGDSYKGELEKR